MDLQNEIKTWKDFLGKKTNLVEYVSFYWIYETLLPLLEDLATRVVNQEKQLASINERLAQHHII